MDSIYIQQGARDYRFQLSQWEQSPPNPYYLFIDLFIIYLLVLFDYFIIVVVFYIIDVIIYLFI